MKIKDITMCGIFAGVTAVLAQISVPLPFTPIPIAFGIVGVFLCGALLSPKCAFLSQFVYLLIGAAGAPVFAGFQGGIAKLAGPTGGYLFAYPFMALLISLFFKKAYACGVHKSPYWLQFIASFGVMVTALALCYTLGTFWFSMEAGISVYNALTKAVIPFIPLDVIKITGCSAVLIPIKVRMDRALRRA